MFIGFSMLNPICWGLKNSGSVCVTVYYGITAIKPETTFVVQQNVTYCRSKFRTFSLIKPGFSMV